MKELVDFMKELLKSKGKLRRISNFMKELIDFMKELVKSRQY